jgi:large subunit ribosomal protein L25
LQLYYAKTGGHLNRIRASLKYCCPAEQIPPKIEVDVSNLDIGDRVFMHDVEVHPSLKLLSKNENMPICKIVATEFENQEPATKLENQEPANL